MRPKKCRSPESNLSAAGVCTFFRRVTPSPGVSAATALVTANATWPSVGNCCPSTLHPPMTNGRRAYLSTRLTHMLFPIDGVRSARRRCVLCRVRSVRAGSSFWDHPASARSFTTMVDFTFTLQTAHPARSSADPQHPSSLMLRCAEDLCGKSRLDAQPTQVRAAIRSQGPSLPLPPVSPVGHKVCQMPVTTRPSGSIMRPKCFEGDD